MHPTTLGVIGLGAIGGSVAWQAVRAGVPRVRGFAAHPRDGAAALRSGAVTELAEDVRGVTRGADLVVVAIPPRATVELLGTLAPELGPGTLCTDVASVKAPVMHRALELGIAGHFAGSHPFAGTERSGFAAARPDRFRDAVVYVTAADGGERAADEVADFWERVLEAQPVRVDPVEHDRLLGWTSHLPQAVASALALALARHGPKGARYGAGARSTTRLAASDSAMWTDILLMNREQLLAALGAVETTMHDLRGALESGDARAVERWLEQGAAWRRRIDP